nr:MAG TPA: hypothetical protein [Caudoviricetes sp.]
MSFSKSKYFLANSLSVLFFNSSFFVLIYITKLRVMIARRGIIQSSKICYKIFNQSIKLYISFVFIFK